MKLADIDPELLSSSQDEGGWEGLYDNIQFVLRLTDRNHRILDGIGTGLRNLSDLTPEQIQAYSTYIHETVHWWQHIGSTAGLVLSLGYPSQFNGNAQHLKDLLDLGVLVKPIRSWSEQELKSGGSSEGISQENRRLALANTVVNNCMDIEFYKIAATSPNEQRSAYKSPYFESIGHSYRIAYSQALTFIAATVDAEFKLLPFGPRWDDEFRLVSGRKVENYYYGSPVKIAPIGLRAIFEGQARMIQLQFLSFCTTEILNSDYIYAYGYLDDIYGEAFDIYSKILGAEEFDSVKSPVVSLFLLICDISINPSAGIPFDIVNFESFIENVDPGVRFINLCHAAKAIFVGGMPNIKDYSSEEYSKISLQLTEECGYDHPLASLEAISSWPDQGENFRAIMIEKDTFLYSPENLPMRVILSHFISFSQDKLRRPEFFCWPGAWLAGEKASADHQDLFLKNLSLFSDRAGNKGIFPRDIPGKDPDGLNNTLNYFYSFNILYDLTKQWILDDGPFKLNYSWLSQEATEEQVKNFARNIFKNFYNINLDDIIVIN